MTDEVKVKKATTLFLIFFATIGTSVCLTFSDVGLVRCGVLLTSFCLLQRLAFFTPSFPSLAYNKEILTLKMVGKPARQTKILPCFV